MPRGPPCGRLPPGSRIRVSNSVRPVRLPLRPVRGRRRRWTVRRTTPIRPSPLPPARWWTCRRTPGSASGTRRSRCPWWLTARPPTDGRSPGCPCGTRSSGRRPGRWFRRFRWIRWIRAAGPGSWWRATTKSCGACWWPRPPYAAYGARSSARRRWPFRRAGPGRGCLTMPRGGTGSGPRRRWARRLSPCSWRRPLPPYRGPLPRPPTLPIPSPPRRACAQG